MILSDIAVRRPTIAIVLNLLLVVFGIVSISKVPLRQYPDIDPPVVGVNTTYSGASADIVDTKITRVLEDQLSSIDGIKYIDSVSRDGSSSITIEFELSRDIEAAVNDVQQSIGRALASLPQEVDPPRVSKADTNARPIMWFNMVSDSMTLLEMSDYARRAVIDRLAVVDGVARVLVGGQRDYAMRIYLDRRAMAARGLTVADVEDALRAENVELPAGRIESQSRNFTARISQVYRSPEDFTALVLGRGDDGHLVRLGEVAQVELAAESDENSFRRDGINMLGLGIVKQSQANTVEVAENARAAIALINQTLPAGLEIQDSYDSSVYVTSSIEEVYNTLAIAVVLVVLVIYLFLGEARATLIPALTVPISLVAAFTLVYALGFSINILTLLALVLAIGLVVDDTIVVLENIYRRIEGGEPALLASYRGAREVGFAVVATTLVLLAVFVPLVFLEGNVGRLFTEFALTMAAAVAFSSIVALTLSPVLCGWLLKSRQHSPGFFDASLSRLEARYERYLRAGSDRAASALLILLVAALASLWLLQSLPGEFTPEEDTGQVIVTFRGPEGSNFQQTSKSMEQVENILLKHFDDWSLDRVILRVPSFGAAEQVNTGLVIVGFVPWENRDQSAKQIRQKMYQAMHQVPDGRIFIFTPSALAGSASTQPVQVVIGADTYEQLQAWREMLLEALADNPVLENVDIDFTVNTQQLEVKVDKERAADLGVSVNAIGRTLETVLGSRRVTTFQDRGEEYDVLVEGLEADYTAPSDLEQIYVRSAHDGKLIPLASVVSVEELAVSPALPRYNRRRALTLNADIAPDYTLDKALEVVQELVVSTLPPSATLDYKGQSLEYIRAGGSVLFVFSVALLVAYLVMAAQFESFLHPLLIMLTVPLAVAGALAGLFVSGQSINIFSQIGLVMLIGLAAKNGILMVEFANQLRDRGLVFEEALYQAARQRLRPILMTSLTTVLGAVPLLLAFGAGAENRFVLGVVIAFGVFSATFLTLFVLPALYLRFARNSSTPGRVVARINALEDDAPG